MKLENKIAELTQTIETLQEDIDFLYRRNQALEKYIDVRLNSNKDGLFFERVKHKPTSLDDFVEYSKKHSCIIPFAGFVS